MKQINATLYEQMTGRPVDPKIVLNASEIKTLRAAMTICDAAHQRIVIHTRDVDSDNIYHDASIAIYEVLDEHDAIPKEQAE